MSWIDRVQALDALIAQAVATFRQLGHRGGFAPTDERGVFMAACPLCWGTAFVRARSFGRAPLSGDALALRCSPPPMPPNWRSPFAV